MKLVHPIAPALLIAAGAILASLPLSGHADGIFSAAAEIGRIIQRNPQGAIITNASAKIVQPSDLVVPTNIPFGQQVLLHAQVLKHLAQVLTLANANLKAARTAKNFDNYVGAEQDIANANQHLAAYALAQIKARTLIAEGYRLYDMSGQMCIEDRCQPVGSAVAVFFLTSDKKKGLGPIFTIRAVSAVVPTNAAKTIAQAKPSGGQDDKGVCPAGPSCSLCVDGFNLCTFYDWLADKPLENSPLKFLPAIRDAIIPPDNNGELAKFIRDPGKTALQDFQNIRDHVLPIPDDNSTGSMIIRNPGCAVARLWHGC